MPYKALRNTHLAHECFPGTYLGEAASLILHINLQIIFPALWCVYRSSFSIPCLHPWGFCPFLCATTIQVIPYGCNPWLLLLHAEAIVVMAQWRSFFLDTMPQLYHTSLSVCMFAVSNITHDSL